MVCDVVEIAAGVGVAWALRDGVGLAASVAAVVASALSVLTALVPVDVCFVKRI